MTTTPQANRTFRRPPKPFSTDTAANRIIGDRLLAKLERELVAFQLSDCERDFDFQNCVVDDNFEPLPLPPETVRKIGNNRELIRDALIRRQRILEKFQEAWWYWDTGGYREECQRYWAMQKNVD